MTIELLYQGRDLLAEATNGKLHITDPGMDELGGGYEQFPKGSRVEVRINRDEPYKGWVVGTVVEVPEDNDRAIVVLCDQKWHDNMENYDGRGATIMVAFMIKAQILSMLRKPEPRLDSDQGKSTGYTTATQSDNQSTRPTSL